MEWGHLRGYYSNSGEKNFIFTIILKTLRKQWECEQSRGDKLHLENLVGEQTEEREGI